MEGHLPRIPSRGDTREDFSSTSPGAFTGEQPQQLNWQELEEVIAVLAEEDRELLGSSYDPLSRITQIIEQCIKRRPGGTIDRNGDKYRTICQSLELLAGQLQDSLDRIFDDCYMGFNTSLKKFAQVLKRFSDAHTQIGDTKADVKRTKKVVRGRTSTIARLWSENLQCSHALRLLDKIEEVTRVPALLTKFERGKHYLHAVHLLVDALNLLASDEFMRIEALKDLREQLLERKVALESMLIEELHRHIYLKAPSLEGESEAASMLVVLPGEGGSADRRAGPRRTRVNGDSPWQTASEEVRSAVRVMITGSSEGDLSGTSKGSPHKQETSGEGGSGGGGGRGGRSPSIEQMKLPSGGVARLQAGSSHRRTVSWVTGDVERREEGTTGEKSDLPATKRPERRKPSPDLRNTATIAAASQKALPKTGHIRSGSGRTIAAVSGNEFEEPEIVDDLEANPERDSKMFMRLVLEALDVLDVLPKAKHRLGANLQSELQTIVQGKVITVHESFMTSRKGVVRSCSVGPAVMLSNLPKSTLPLAPGVQRGVGPINHERDGVPAEAPMLVTLLQEIASAFQKVLLRFTLVLDVFRKKSLRKQMKMQELYRPKLSEQAAYLVRGHSGFFYRTPLRDKENDFGIDDVWHRMQIELQLLLCDVLNIPKPEVSDAVSIQEHLLKFLSSSIIGEPSDALSLEWPGEMLSFSFAQPSTHHRKQPFPSPPQPPQPQPAQPLQQNDVSAIASSSLFENLHPVMMHPSPYHIVSLYRHMLQFVDLSVAIVQASGYQGSFKEGGVREFMDLFIQKSFLPRINGHYHHRLVEILNAEEAFKSWTAEKGVYSEDDSRRPLLQGVIMVSQLLQELFSDLASLPLYVSNFVHAAEMILEKFLEKCSQKYAEVITGALSSFILRNEGWVEAMKGDPLWLEIEAARPEEVKSSQASQVGGDEFLKQDAAMDEFLMKRRIQKGELILDGTKLGLLASLSDSLEWLACMIAGLGADAIETTAHKPSSSPSPRPITLNVVPSGSRPSHRRNMSSTSGCRHRQAPSVLSSSTISALSRESSPGGPFRPLPPMPPALGAAAQSLSVLEERFRALGGKCLMLLRGEVRVHCFFFLQDIAKSSYWAADAQVEAEPWIQALNKDLSTAEENVSRLLPAVKVRYLFEGLPQLISTILIRTLPKLMAEHGTINRNIINKMSRNVFALQQNMTDLAVSKEIYWSKVRQYYELMLFEEDPLKAWVMNHRTRYTREVLHQLFRAKRMSEATIAELNSKLQAAGSESGRESPLPDGVMSHPSTSSSFVPRE